MIACDKDIINLFSDKGPKIKVKTDNDGKALQSEG
jgi:hypothetical protein